MHAQSETICHKSTTNALLTDPDDTLEIDGAVTVWLYVPNPRNTVLVFEHKRDFPPEARVEQGMPPISAHLCASLTTSSLNESYID